MRPIDGIALEKRRAANCEYQRRYKQRLQAGLVKPRLTDSERFESHCCYVGDCIVWTGNAERYGQMSLKSKPVYAHRFAYALKHGPIPEGLTIDHLCRNKLCVNVAHLEAVTMKENNLRRPAVPSAHSKKTHCPHGHPYSGENLYRWKNNRYCRACISKYTLRWQKAKKADQ